MDNTTMNEYPDLVTENDAENYIRTIIAQGLRCDLCNNRNQCEVCALKKVEKAFKILKGYGKVHHLTSNMM